MSNVFTAADDRFGQVQILGVITRETLYHEVFGLISHSRGIAR